MKDLQTSNPKEHSRNLKSELQMLTDHFRKDTEKVNDPKAKALFETSAEVLTGLITALTHYEQESEEAWK